MATEHSTRTDARTDLDARDNLDAREQEALEAKMPASLKASEFVEGFGRTFECPECGSPSSGTCGECGYTHSQLRDDPDRRVDE